MNVDLSPHFKLIKPIGPKLMGLHEIFVSDGLQESIDSNNLLEALRLGIGVNEFYALRKGSAVGNVTKKLLCYAA